ncbi:MAG: hypothetical protein FWB93_06055 [Oscillospiraceae bacterium]|nr:hypothetical protein [Oscillospiraceae bacterium]
MLRKLLIEKGQGRNAPKTAGCPPYTVFWFCRSVDDPPQNIISCFWKY